MCGICGKLNFDRENHVTPDLFRQCCTPFVTAAPMAKAYTIPKTSDWGTGDFPSSTWRPASSRFVTRMAPCG